MPFLHPVVTRCWNPEKSPALGPAAAIQKDRLLEPRKAACTRATRWLPEGPFAGTQKSRPQECLPMEPTVLYLILHDSLSHRPVG